MGVNKVEFDGRPLIDISDSTVESNSVLEGKRFYGKDGNPSYGNIKTLSDISVKSEYKTAASLPINGYLEKINVRPSTGIHVEKIFDDYNTYIEIDAEEEGNLIEHIDITQPFLTTMPYPITISAGGSFIYDYKEHDNSPLAKVEVYAESPIYQNKTVTPTTEKQIIKPDKGVDALGEVVVNPIPINRVPNSKGITLKIGG